MEDDGKKETGGMFDARIDFGNWNYISTGLPAFVISRVLQRWATCVGYLERYLGTFKTSTYLRWVFLESQLSGTLA